MSAEEKRCLSLVVEIDQPDSDWIWDSIRDRITLHGIKVLAISEGDVFESLQEFERDLNDVKLGLDR